MKKANLTLVGAGPGDPELITLKGLKALELADVLLYDSLVNTKIFDLAFKDLDSNPELIYVGKRRGLESLSQDEINNLILEHLKLGRKVVRLKGGDPFIFARGVEEIALAREHGYSASVIPGLTSGLAVPVSAGKTLTLRKKSDSVTLATAHNLNDSKFKLWSEILKTGSTLIIYMGLFNVVELVEGLSVYLDAGLPVAAIQDGTLPEQKVLSSKLKDLAQDIIDKSLKSPVILVFGEHIESLTEDPGESTYYMEMLRGTTCA